MEIGEIGHLGHHVHERVEVLYKNHSDSVIIQSKFKLNNLRESIFFLFCCYIDQKMVVDIVRVNQHEYDHVKIIQ